MLLHRKWGDTTEQFKFEDDDMFSVVDSVDERDGVAALEGT